MADSTGKPFALFRFSADNNTEANIADDEAVGFDVGITEASQIGIISFKVIGDARVTDVPAPDQLSTSKPDTGNVGPIWEIQFVANEKLADSKELARLWKWYLEAKSVRGTYSRGRFGIRYNDKPYLNVLPANGSGLKLTHLEMEDVIEFGGMVVGSLSLQLAGTNAQIITRINSFLSSS